MSDVPLYCEGGGGGPHSSGATKRTSPHFGETFALKLAEAKAKIWPWLSYLYRIRATAATRVTVARARQSGRRRLSWSDVNPPFLDVEACGAAFGAKPGIPGSSDRVRGGERLGGYQIFPKLQAQSLNPNLGRIIPPYGTGVSRS